MYLAIAAALALALLLLLVPPQGVSSFGSPVTALQCAATAEAPWPLETAAFAPEASVGAPALRVAIYNLHSGLGGSFAWRRPRAEVEANLREIAAVLAAAAPPEAPVDVVGLNEVDFEARRSGGFDQARFLAEELSRLTGQHYAVVAGETWRRQRRGFEARFGNAALVRHPLREARACLFEDPDCSGAGDLTRLPAIRSSGWFERALREPRGVVKLTLDFHGQPVDVLVTHLDAFSITEREAQAAHLLHRFVDPARTTVLLGDMNTVPAPMTGARFYFAADRTHDVLTSGRLADARVMLAAQQGLTSLSNWATFPAHAPVWPLDGVFASSDLIAAQAEVIGAQQSDHRGLLVHYALAAGAAELGRNQARHDEIRRRQLARILACDMRERDAVAAAKAHWLATGTHFLEIASTVERHTLLSLVPALAPR